MALVIPAADNYLNTDDVALSPVKETPDLTPNHRP
jgi:hypothetical protein